MGELFKFIFSKLFLKHICFVIGGIVLLGCVVLFSLGFYTHHGESIEVPNVKGQSLMEAMQTLQDLDLKCEVVDSTYNPKLPPGTIVEETPVAGEKVKKYRTIYLIINSYQKPTISMPDVRDLSMRNAKATLESIGLNVVGVESTPSTFGDLVKAVKIAHTNSILAPGTKVQVQTNVILVVTKTGMMTDSAATDSAIMEDVKGSIMNESAPSSSKKKPVDDEDFF